MKADYKNWVPDGGTGLDVEIIFLHKVSNG